MFYLLAIIVFFVVIFAITKFSKAKAEVEMQTEEQKQQPQVLSDCCGAHEICEFDEAKYNPEIIEYFDDEELDVLRNVREDQFTAADIDQLRDVLYTLRPEEISKWLTSLSRRHIHLPVILQQEARQLLAERK